MSSPIISVENLGKCYRIHHEKQESYTALRDVIARKVKGLWKTANREPRTTNSEEDFWALKDVSFEVKPGEVVGIIGRNGAGKSTLLKILSRITEPTQGRITLRGRVASLLEVGTGFHPELTGRENIYLNGAILGMTKAEIKSKFDEIVAFAEIEKFLDTPVKRYSSGMYVRLAFAVAAHLDPEILIVDEVLAVGDALFQEKCTAKIRQIATSGARAVLFVSHNMATVSTLCTKAVLLSKGTVVASGSPTTIIDQYLNQPRNAQEQLAQRCVYEARSSPDHATPMQLRLIEVQDKTGQRTGHVSWNEPLVLKVEIDSSRWIAGAVLGYYLTDQRGRKVFTSNCEKWPVEVTQSSLVVAACEIPGSFLVPGSYSASFVLSVERQSHIDAAIDAVEFSVGNEGSPLEEFLGSDYGSVFASCEWQTSVIPSVLSSI